MRIVIGLLYYYIIDYYYINRYSKDYRVLVTNIFKNSLEDLKN